MTDELSVSRPILQKLPCVQTKREALQIIASIFDPLGYFAPSILEANFFMRQLWVDNCDWDTKLNKEQTKEWLQIAKNLEIISQHRMPRYIGINETHCEAIKYTLICFCDASAKAYSAAIYLSQSLTDSCKTDLIFCKTCLAPQNTTIPRLELLGVLIGVRTLKFVIKELHLLIDHTFVFTDSLCVLYWLLTKKPLSIFVTNRLKEIRALEGVCFRHVPSEDNPADLATRGKAPTELSSMWWKGPSWLSKCEHYWPTSKTPVMDNGCQQLFESEIKPSKVLYEAKLVVGEAPCGERVDLSDIGSTKFLSLYKLLRVTGWILRFISRLKTGNCKAGPITTLELEQAKLLWDKHVQLEHYYDVIHNTKKGAKNNLKYQLNLQMDPNGLLRCHGRLNNAELTQAAKHPKLLPKSSHYTRLVAMDAHCKVLHSGTSQTLARLWQEYWIPHGRTVIKKLIKDCKMCRRVEGTPFTMPRMPSLPTERVARSQPFEYTGVDYFGPMFVKDFSLVNDQLKEQYKRKVWVCLFTCFMVRTIHLKLVEDMSTEEFLLCLHRFIARHGPPRMILSDNAQQFKTSKAVLEKAWRNVLTNETLNEFTSNQGIRWRFIVELAPWMGGFYERLVGLTKRALRKTIGTRYLTQRQLATVLTEVKAVINTRPLVYVDDDINSSVILTPMHFLSLHSSNVIPDLTEDNDPEHDTYIEERLCRAVAPDMEAWTETSKSILVSVEK